MTDEHLESLAGELHLKVEFVRLCVLHGVVSVEELRMAPAAHRARMRRLQRLCRDLEVDVFAGSIIVGLLDRLDDLASELEHLRLQR